MSDDDPTRHAQVYQQVDWVGADAQNTMRFRAVCDHCGNEGTCVIFTAADGSHPREWHGFSLMADSQGSEHPSCPYCNGRSVNITHQIDGGASDAE